MTRLPRSRTRIGLVGLGWYGADVARFLVRTARRSSAIEFVGILEPGPGGAVRSGREMPGATGSLVADSGVPIVGDWTAMAALEPDVLWLTVPIAAHRPALEAALALRPSVVLVEKPAAAAIQDVDAMSAAGAAARIPVLIAYQANYDPGIAEVARQIGDGAIGRVVEVAAHAAGPRGDSYYGRAAWAGRMGDSRGWILDSPATNGNAHEVHLAFHLAGQGHEAPALPTSVEAELYRSNPIESFDVVSGRAATTTGVTVTIALGHPCVRDVPRCIRVRGSAGAALVLVDRIVLATRNRTMVIPLLRDARVAMLRQVVAVAGGRLLPDHGHVPVAEARAQVLFIDTAVAAAPIIDVPDEAVTWAAAPMGRVRAIVGLEELLTEAAARNATLSEVGGARWMVPPHRGDALAMRRFEGPARP